jgi:hypothetical protein
MWAFFLNAVPLSLSRLFTLSYSHLGYHYIV